MQRAASETKNPSLHAGSDRNTSRQKHSFVTDTRAEAIQLKAMKEMTLGQRTIAQRQEFTEAFGQANLVSTPNQTGMPDTLKTGLEGMSGIDLSDVRVHYNSPRPEQLQALAYAHGPDIYLAPGQERHLPHEGWHVVQQKQGRVAASGSVGGVPVNDSPLLEQEADVVGKKAAQYSTGAPSQSVAAQNRPVVQRVKKKRVALGVALTLFSLGLIWLSPSFRKYMLDAVIDQPAQLQTVNVNPDQDPDQDYMKDYAVNKFVKGLETPAKLREDGTTLKTRGVMDVLELSYIPPELSDVDIDRCQDRGISDTLLFIDVINTRYGKKNLRQYEKIILEALDNLQGQYITRKMILDVLSTSEKKSGGVKNITSEAFDDSVAGIANSREGAYRWDKSHDDFFDWINDDSMRELPVGARVNCWEAALAAVINAGKLTRKEVAATYIKLKEPRENIDEPDEPIWYDTKQLEEVFTRRIVDTISNTGKNNRKELIKRDDILVYNKAGEPLFHVMIALGNEAGPGSYNDVPVMSLWKQNAGSFTVRKLGELIILDLHQTINICRF
jgi:hypothetical protein